MALTHSGERKEYLKADSESLELWINTTDGPERERKRGAEWSKNA